MAVPICERILQRLAEVVQNAVVSPVYRSRDAALASSQLPAVIITPLSDDPAEEGGTICWLDWTLTVAVDVVVGAGLDAVAHEIRAEAHAAVMADRDLAPVPGVIDVVPGRTLYQLTNVGGEHAFLRCLFLVAYRTRYDDLAVAQE